MIKIAQTLAKEKVFVLIAFFLLAFFLYSFFIEKKETIFADGIGYFSYPFLLFTEGEIDYNNHPNIFGVNKLDVNTYFNKYPLGTGFFLIPAYLTSYVGTSILGQDNHLTSQSNQFFVGLWGIIYLLIGLFILQKILLNYFSKKITNLTLIVTTFGTNLFIYGTVDASFSHIYSFLLINLFILFTIRWHQLPNRSNTVLLGISLGLIPLVRNSNIIVLFFFLLYNIKLDSFKEDILNKFLLFTAHYKKLLSILLVTLLIMFPQIFYWYTTTKNLIFYSYINESFNFKNPEIVNLLFNAKRGVLLWHPILLVGIWGLSKARMIALASLSTIIIITFLISSWWMWDYGIGFGHRGFTDFMVFFALGIGTVINQINKLRFKNLIIAVIFLLFILNIILSINYVQGDYTFKELSISYIFESLF